MMREALGKVKIASLDESNVDDLIFVCSSKRLNDLVHQKGIELKKRWLKEMLDDYGSCAKIAYHDGEPVAQILYFPEEAERTKTGRRKNVLVINCVYNPSLGAQRLGIGRMLLESVVEEAKQKKTCLGNKPCKFILAKAFNTGELLSLPEFYKKHGFIQTPRDEGNLVYLPIEGSYEPTEPVDKYESLEEDRDKAVVFYGPVCQFGYPFAKTIESLVKEAAPKMKVELIDEWEHPQEAIKRRNQWLVVNAKPIHTFFMDKERFMDEVKRAAE
jgi:GNAT superfamily N-acetyltransferase